jgi:hypothetical protein
MSTASEIDPLTARRFAGGFERSSQHDDHLHRSDAVKTSAGVFQSSTFLGRWFSLVSTSRIWSSVSVDRSVPFGQYCRSRPLDAPMFCQAALASVSAVFAGTVAA